MPSRHAIVTTRSGAAAVRDDEVGELMHPVLGPVEAELLYVGPARLEARLREGRSGEPLVLFDVGLGAGSNALAARRVAQGSGDGCRRLSIVSFERDVGALELVLASDRAAEFGLAGGARRAARDLLDRGVHEGARCTWRLERGDAIASLARQTSMAEVVFWDPFSPRANPELWTVRAFAALRERCAVGCTVHTYSASTAVRSAMLLAGFAVGIGPATGEKAETTCAALEPTELDRPLDGRWLERLARSSAPWPLDAPPDALDRVRAHPQFGG
jgi:queuine tRNA-ribosyltransferase